MKNMVLLMTIALVGLIPAASAGPNVCNDEPQDGDIWILAAGAVLNHDDNGYVLCVLNPAGDDIGVGVDEDAPSEGESGLVLEIYQCQADSTPCTRIIDDTGYYQPDSDSLVYCLVINGDYAWGCSNILD